MPALTAIFHNLDEEQVERLQAIPKSHFATKFGTMIDGPKVLSHGVVEMKLKGGVSRKEHPFDFEDMIGDLRTVSGAQPNIFDPDDGQIYPALTQK